MAFSRARRWLALFSSRTRLTDADDRYSHPIFGEHLTTGLHGGGPDANYTICTSDPSTAAQWIAGPETWEQVMVEQIQFHKTVAECNGSDTTRVVMMWEYANLQCDGDRSCYIFAPGSPNTQHSTGDGLHWHVNRAHVVYNQQLYQALPSDSWRDSSSVHEFGHVMALADHGELSRCDIPWIMAYPPPSPPTV